MRVLRLAVLVLATVDENFLEPKAAELASANPKESSPVFQNVMGKLMDLTKQSEDGEVLSETSVKKLIEEFGIDEEKINEVKERAGPIFQKVMGQILDPKKQSEGGEDPQKMISEMFGIDEEKINELKEQFMPTIAEAAQNLGKLFEPEEGQDGEKLNAIGQLFKMVQNMGVLAQDESESAEEEDSEDDDAEFGDFVKLAQDKENLRFDIDILNAITENIIDDLPFTLDEVKNAILNEANEADEFGNNDGKVSLVEVINQLKGKIVERVDDDEDGSVSRRELRKAATAVLGFMNLSFSDEQIDHLYRVLDKDQDGDVTLEEMNLEPDMEAEDL